MNRNKHWSANRAFYCIAGLALALPGASMAQTLGNQSAKPVWPDNGIAQRKLPGAYNMFVEQDEHGQWHAWAMNGYGKDAQAVDFFSGEQIHVEAGLRDDGQQSRDFVDLRGIVHGPQSDRFMFSQGSLPGINISDELSLNFSDSQCPASFLGLKGLSENDPLGNHPIWKKVPIYHVAPRAKDCPSGYLRSSIETAMDLEDGTFLVTMNCWVFRLRKSVLSPVGSAPALHVVNQTALQVAIDQAKGKDVQDANAYLARALNLSFDDANSCQSGF